MIRREWFVVNKYAEEKCAGRREVLQKAEGGKAQMLRSVPEPNLWQGGDNAGAHQQDRQ